MSPRDWRYEMLHNPDNPPAMRELTLNGGPGLPPRQPMLPADVPLALTPYRFRNCLGRLATRAEQAHCYGCHRPFPSASCMVRHHERRSCVSPTRDIAVYEAALRSEGRSMVLVREQGRPAVATYPPREGHDGLRFEYKCTRCVALPSVSEFLRHVEDGVCELDLESGGAMDLFSWELMLGIPMARGGSCPKYSPS